MTEDGTQILNFLTLSRSFRVFCENCLFSIRAPYGWPQSPVCLARRFLIAIGSLRWSKCLHYISDVHKAIPFLIISLANHPSWKIYWPIRTPNSYAICFTEEEFTSKVCIRLGHGGYKFDFTPKLKSIPSSIFSLLYLWHCNKLKKKNDV